VAYFGTVGNPDGDVHKHYSHDRDVTDMGVSVHNGRRWAKPGNHDYGAFDVSERNAIWPVGICFGDRAFPSGYYVYVGDIPETNTEGKMKLKTRIMAWLWSELFGRVETQPSVLVKSICPWCMEFQEYPFWEIHTLPVHLRQECIYCGSMFDVLVTIRSAADLLAQPEVVSVIENGQLGLQYGPDTWMTPTVVK